MIYENPLSADILTNLFRTSLVDEYRIINRESVTIEFKESYNHASIAQYFKTIASFANNMGGYLIFGVGDKPRRLIGLKEKSLEQFETLKVEEFTKALMDCFSPSIRWEHCTFEFKGLSFGVIYVYELKRKPCVCKKTYDNPNPKYTLKESDIYFRHGARSERIKYDELMAILDSNRISEENKWLSLIQKIAKIGIDNAMIFNVETGDLSGNGHSIIFDDALLDKIQFIKKGEFVEAKGQPALRLIGDIETMSSGRVVVKETEKKVVKAIEPYDIIESFLSNDKTNEPLEYIKRICSTSTANFPIYYYIQLSGLPISSVIEMIREIPSRSTAKTKLIERLEGKRVEKSSLPDVETKASAEKRQYMLKWLGESLNLSQADLNRCIQAFLCLTDDEIREHNTYIRQVFKSIFTTYFEMANSTIASMIRKSICKIDEALYLE